MMAVTVPAGIGPGGTFAFQTPDGNMLEVTCPPDAMEGQVIQVQPSTTMAVTVPAGIGPGGTFAFQTPDGNMIKVTCPPDAMEGQVIQVEPSTMMAVTVPAGIGPPAGGGQSKSAKDQPSTMIAPVLLPAHPGRAHTPGCQPGGVNRKEPWVGMTHSRAGLPDFIDNWSQRMDELPPGFLSTKKLPSMKKVLTYPESRKKLLSKEIEELLESK